MESTYLSDQKYRTFRSSVERAVKNFETSSEWADLISCLTKLNKILQTAMQYDVLPKKVTIAKRLAQCLHPALPSGVHIKALETYHLILKRIGSRGLAQDLFLFTSGLFPLLAHASMTVKPALLGLYENHFVPLGRDLIPCLRGLVLALLSGLEEGSETFERNNALLLDVSKRSDAVLFFGAVWHAILACPHIRLPAVNFLVSQISKQLAPNEQLHLVGEDVNRTIAAISAAFFDENVLVLRSLLDLVLILFPFDQQFPTHSDMNNILASALTVLLRRDMSLNRRFYTWILGTSSSSDDSDVASEQRYFEAYSKQPLISSVFDLLKRTDPNKQEGNARNVKNSLKSFRIVMALLDKLEIGMSLVDAILLESLQSLRVCYSYWAVRETSLGMKSPRSMRRKGGGEGRGGGGGEDVLKTVNLLCGLFESGFVWQFIAERIEKVARAMGHSEGEHFSISITELSSLVEFLLDSLFMRSNDDVSTIHLPTLLTHCLISLCLCCASSCLQDLTAGFQLCSRLLSCCEPSAKPAIAPQSLLDKMKSVCGSQLQQTGDCDLASCSIELAKLCLVSFIESHIDAGGLMCGTGRPSSEHELGVAFDALCRLLIDVSSFPVLNEDHTIPDSPSLSCFASERGWLQSLLSCITSTTSFTVFASATTTILDLAAVGVTYDVSREESHVSSVIIKPLITASDFNKIRSSGLIQAVVERLWCVLESGDLQCKESAANLMAQVCALRPCIEIVESTINDRLTSTSLMERRSSLQTFSYLWELTEHGSVNTLTPSYERPLFVMLENLYCSDTFSRQITTSWLSKLLRLGDMNRLLSPLLQVLLHPSTTRSRVTCTAMSGDWMKSNLLLYVQSYDTHRCRHALECLQSIVTADTHGFVSAASLSVVSQHAGQMGLRNIRSLLMKQEVNIAQSKNNKSTGDSSPVTRNYMETLLSVLLWFMQSYMPASISISSDVEKKALVEDNALIQTLATRICIVIVEQLDSAFASSSSFSFHLPASGGYIRALFTLCEVHEALLSCLAATLQQQLDRCACPEFLWSADSSMALMVEMLKLTFAVLRLEYSQGLSHRVADNAQSVWSVTYSDINGASCWQVLELCPLAQQPPLLTLILHGLSSVESECVMQHFLQFLCNALPLIGVVLPVLVQHVIVRLCTVLRRCSLRQSQLLVTALAHIMQFCLLRSDETATSSHSAKRSFVLDFDSLTGSSPLSSHVIVQPMGDKNEEGGESAAAICLFLLPRTLRSLTSVWKNASEVEHLFITKKLKELIVHLLQLFVASHDNVLLASAARLWSQFASTENNREEETASDEWQLVLLDMLKSIPTLPLDGLIRSAIKLFKESTDDDIVPCVIMFLQQIFLRSSSKDLLGSWPEFYVLVKEVLPQVISTPPDLFSLVRTLHAFTSVVAACKEKKIRKEAQELTQKILDGCCSIVSTSLERKSWLGRSLVIRPSLLSNTDGPQVQPDITESESDSNKTHNSTDMNGMADDDDVNAVEDKEQDEEVIDNGKSHSSPDLSEFTTQALEVMSQSLAPFVDSMFGGEEKDRVVSLLYNVLAYVFPFLRCHNSAAASSYCAASALLSSVSEYQYTKKAWSKEAFELFLDALFFQMDASSLRSWLSIVDNLMTQDKSTFKELLSRSQTPVQGGLALFSSTEQDIEQRTRFVKRLAFAVFSGELDQYHRHLPSIQERLSESLRIQPAPLLHEKVFLFLRVLLLRISPHHLASFWPIINTELVHVFQQLEQDICIDSSQYTLSPESKEMLDDSWARLYLAACKLLELPQHVPPERVPQFQMHGWGFCHSASSDEHTPMAMAFQPYTFRAFTIIKKRLTAATPSDGLVRQLASSLERLHMSSTWPLNSKENGEIKRRQSGVLFTQSVCEYEDMVLKDFLEQS